MVFAEGGIEVVGVEAVASRCDEVNAGRSYIQDVAGEALRKMVDAGLIHATTDYAATEDCDADIICLPTPLNANREPDLTLVTDATAKLAGHLNGARIAILGCGPIGLSVLLAARQARRASQMDEARLQWIFSLFPAVETFWNHPAGKLSGGQKQMLAVARAIVEPRELLIVDEPSKGLAPAIINNMIDAFAQLKSTGTTILLVEQNISFAKRLGDSVAVMDHGQVVYAGAMQALAEDEALQRSLLGLAL